LQLQVIRLLSGSDAFESITLIDANSESVYCGSIPENIVHRSTSDRSVSNSNANNRNSKRSAPEWRIGLKELCALHDTHGNIRFVQGKVIDIDLDLNLIQLLGSGGDGDDGVSTEIPYDIISIDIGSKSKSIKEIPGAYGNVIPTRPMKDLMDTLKDIENDFDKEEPLHHSDPINVAVVGGGASGIELALSIVGRWKPLLGDRLMHVMLITSEKILLPETAFARKRLKDILVDKGIYMLFNSAVTSVDKGCLHLKSGMAVPFSYCLWATGPGPHALAKRLHQNGLDVSDDGWIEVNNTLQSRSHCNVFAAGDCSSLVNPLPKSGVFALQEGPILAKNLERYALNEPRVDFHPNMEDLQFLNIGDGTAMGFAFGMVLRGEWVYEVKQAMDRRHFLSLTGGDDTSTSSPYRCNSEVLKQLDLIPTPQAAKLLTQINVDNYQEAWAILERMSVNKDYRLKIMNDYNHLTSSERRRSESDDKRQKKDPQLGQFPPFQFISWLWNVKS
jgi:selenide,water dikinase